MFANQPDVLKRTSETTMTEWNFGHHLANEIAKYISWLSHDMDVVKRNHENRRPDISFHKRGTDDFNLLAIEIKIDGSVQKDIQKIQRHWMRGRGYQFGASIDVKPEDCFNVIVFDRTGDSEEFSAATDYIPIPESSKQIAEIESLIDQILIT